jgi:isopentenyl diphosphate isomerase/L-lactate dehydrogenase-like FMN-dependent dehydrogenase
MDRSLENYQGEIFAAGLNGARPELPTDLSKLEDLAESRLRPEVFGYIYGGAGTGDTMAENAAALRRWRIVPRILADVSSPDYASEVLGTRLAVPMLLAPVGGLAAAYPDGEIAVARAASALGVPMIVSTTTSATVEEIARELADGQRWFQFYWPKSRKVAASLLGRAQSAGYDVLVLTLDTPMLGWRPHDLDHGFTPPLRGIGVGNHLSDPAFRAELAEPPSDNPGAAIAHRAKIFGDPSLTWADLPFLRRHWEGPIVLKGVLSPADAERAAEAGIEGLVVSNHGGRQVDGAIGALDALPPIVAAVGARTTVLFDGGIRGGADIVKALALGARAVLIGRPYIYGLGLAGQDGVTHVLRTLRNDFELTMRLAGHPSLRSLGPDALTASRN